MGTGIHFKELRSLAKRLAKLVSKLGLLRASGKGTRLKNFSFTLKLRYTIIR